MSPDEKLGLMVTTSQPMGISQHSKEMACHDGVLDEQYLPITLGPHTGTGIPFKGTTQMISELSIRHFILREAHPGHAACSWAVGLPRSAPTATEKAPSPALSRR